MSARGAARPDTRALLEFLRTPTPQSWVDQAPEHLDELLIDHANCEKKAASTALSLMYRYAEQGTLQVRLSPLAREELRHFEQVFDQMRELGIEYRRLSSSRYAPGLRDCVDAQEPLRLLDTLLVCAVVEARSAERFLALQPVLPTPLAEFYARLLASEVRHFELYMHLAQEINGDAELIKKRLELFLDADNALIQADDTCFRFHSGPVAADRLASGPLAEGATKS